MPQNACVKAIAGAVTVKFKRRRKDRNGAVEFGFRVVDGGPGGDGKAGQHAPGDHRVETVVGKAAALGDALTVGLTYMAAAVVPLWPYVVLPLMAPALITSIACTLVALFALGVAKGRIARQAWRRAGLQVMLIGSASATVGFAIGHLVTAVTG